MLDFPENRVPIIAINMMLDEVDGVERVEDVSVM